MAPYDSSLEEIPLEMLQAIMSFTRPEDLLALISTSSSVYKAFKSSEAPICFATMVNHMSLNVVPLAMARFKAKAGHEASFDLYQSEYRSRALKLCGLLRTQNSSPSTTTMRLSLPMAIEISHNHDKIESFPGLYSSALGCQLLQIPTASAGDLVMRQGQLVHPQTEEVALQATERNCINRASYIFELMRLVIPRQDDGEEGERLCRAFWTCFAPWEAQQAKDVAAFYSQRLQDVAPQGSFDPETFVAEEAAIHFGLDRFSSLVGDHLVHGSSSGHTARLHSTLIGEGPTIMWRAYRSGLLNRRGLHRTRDFRSDRYRPLYHFWLRRKELVDEDGPFDIYSLDLRLDQYKDDDSGPRDYWYFDLIRNIVQANRRQDLTDLYWSHERFDALVEMVASKGSYLLGRNTWDSLIDPLPTTEFMTTLCGHKWMDGLKSEAIDLDD